ncbi:ATP-grasp domain-containing protein [Streptomyces sp. NPDC050448]|uniref:ATP-grasp domain-containing protein n=1 Tax=Streptomyces sp. NPDC050448 TaxID=3155404 RepID=UPI0034462A09
MTVAIVDGYATARFLVAALAERGTQCVHVASDPHPPAAYQRVFNPAVYLHDLGHHEDIEVIATRLRELGVGQVIAGAESGVQLADALNHELGTPGNDITRVAARRDKFAMAEQVRASGLAAPATVIAGEPDQAVDWFTARGGRPVVVKPPASAGTNDVSVCRTAEEVASRCAALIGTVDFFGATNEHAVVQEFLDGEEFMVNTVSVDGVHKVVDVWRSVRTAGPHGAPICDFQEPLPLTDGDVRQVAAYTLDVVTALGIANGAGHTEVMLTADGPVLIESAARLMGGFLPWVSEKFSGTSQIQLLAVALTNCEEFQRFSEADAAYSQHVRNVWLINRRPGPGREDGWQQRIESLPTFVALTTKVVPGQTVPLTVDLPSAPGFVSLAGGLAEVERDHRLLREMEGGGLYVG